MDADTRSISQQNDKLEGQRARRVTDHPYDLLTVLLREHEDVLERRRITESSADTDDQSTAQTEERKPEIKTDGNPIAAYLEKAHRCGDLSALCLSGGGIRSAAFAFGVIQALGKYELLDKFDRLSTVSGGGYIGSWLTAWVQRRGYESVLRAIPSNRTPELHSPLSHLWRYSRYLAPRAGFLSTDALTLVTLYFRNLLLNWLVLLPFLILAIVATKALAVASWSIPASWTGMFVALAMMFAGWALLDSLLQRPGWEARNRSVIPFVAAELVPMILGAICASMATSASYRASLGIQPSIFIRNFALSGSTLAALAWLFAYYFASSPQNRRHAGSVEIDIAEASGQRSIIHHVIMAALAFIGSGAVVGVLLASVVISTAGMKGDTVILALIALGPTVVVLAIFAGELFYTGLTSYAPWGDAEREWLARSGGRHGLAAVLWGIAVGTVLFGSLAVSSLLGVFPVAITGGLAGTLIAFLGKAPKTVAIVRDTLQKTLSDYSVSVVLAVAVPIFSVCLIALISWGLDHLIIGRGLTPTALEETGLSPWMTFGCVSLACFVVGALFSCVVNINRFSLHGVYRNRLIRAFLGASNFERMPSPETDFDDRDNISMHELWPVTPVTNAGLPPQLFYINMSLNVLHGRELAWQERKALPFVATARYVGCANLLWVDCDASQRFGCFRSAREYACGRRNDPLAKGLTLGTAMTLSGAAASPNMGYHSSSALSLLLTLFNVRLGGWFANPGPAGAAKTHRAGPTIAVKPLIQEALGLTDEEQAYVYLSDGGHFENLGVYEMIRRRCRYIVVSDAGCDGGYAFEDLGSLVRKVSIDFGVDIRFSGLEHLRSRRESTSVDTPIGAIADIVYPEIPAWPGKLLYIKPAYHGAEPASVRGYGQAHPEFPHEGTTDQFFGEPQFEAYRALGEYSVERLLGNSRFSAGNIASFMTAAEDNLRK